MRDEVLFCHRESIPVRSIGRNVNFFSGPEGSFGLLVHPPDVIVLDGEEKETMGIYLEKWLSSEVACSFGGLVARNLMTHRRRGLTGFLCGRRAGCVVAEFFPVIAILTDEVRDLAEGLIRDDVFKGHDLMMMS